MKILGLAQEALRHKWHKAGRFTHGACCWLHSQAGNQFGWAFCSPITWLDFKCPLGLPVLFNWLGHLLQA